MKNNITLIELKQLRTGTLATMNRHLRSGNLVKATFERQQFDRLTQQINDIESVEEVTENRFRQNKELTAWLCKTISLTKNCADLSVFFSDNANGFFRESGLAPKDKLKEALENTRIALSNLSREYARFLEKECLEDNYNNFDRLEAYIRKELFTDREKVFYDKYSK